MDICIDKKEYVTIEMGFLQERKYKKHSYNWYSTHELQRLWNLMLTYYHLSTQAQTYRKYLFYYEDYLVFQVKFHIVFLDFQVL